MNVDPTGEFWGLFFLIVGISALIMGTGAAAYVGEKAYNEGYRGWELAGEIGKGFLGGALVGASIGALITLLIYAGPAIGSFLSSSFILGYTVTASGAMVAVTVTGAQIAAAGVAALIGLGIVFASDSRPGDNKRQNKQYEEIMRRLGYKKKNWQWRYGHDHLPNEDLGFKDLLKFLTDLFSGLK